MKAAQFVVLVGLASLLACAPVSAAAAERDRFGFSVQGIVEWTDNRDRWEEGKEEANWDFYIKPRADVYLCSERALLDLFYAPSFRYRTDPNRVQNDTELQHDLGLRTRFRVTPRFLIRASDKFDLTDDPKITEEGRTVRADRSYLLNRSEVGANALLGRRMDLDVYGRYGLKRYEKGEVADTSNEDRGDLGLVLRHRLTKKTFMDGRTRFSMFGYEHPGGVDRDFNAVFGGVGVERVFTPHLTAGINGGVQYQTYQDDSIDSATMPAGELWVKTTAAPSTRVTLSLAHAARDADAFPFASQEFSEVRGIFEWDPVQRITLGLTGTYRLSSYEDVYPRITDLGDIYLPADIEEGNEATLDQSAYLDIGVTRKTRVRLVQRFENVDSDVSDVYSYTKNTFTLVVSQRF